MDGTRLEQAIIMAAMDIKTYRAMRVAAGRLHHWDLIDEATAEHVRETCDIRTDTALNNVRDAVGSRTPKGKRPFDFEPVEG